MKPLTERKVNVQGLIDPEDAKCPYMQEHLSGVKFPCTGIARNTALDNTETVELPNGKSIHISALKILK
jgi:hypothetical protein